MASDSETSLGLRDDISQILRVSDQPLEQLEATAQALLSHSDGTLKDLAELCPCLHQSSSLHADFVGLAGSAAEWAVTQLIVTLGASIRQGWLCCACCTGLSSAIPDAALAACSCATSSEGDGRRLHQLWHDVLQCAICTCAGAIFSEAAKQHFSVLWQSIGLSRSASPDDTAAMVSSLISLCHAMPAVLDMLVPDAAHPGWHTALALSPLPPQPDFKQAQQIRVQLALLQATNSLGGAAQVWLLNAMQLGLARSRPAVLADIWQAVLQTVQVRAALLTGLSLLSSLQGCTQAALQESTLVQAGDESSVSHFSRSAFEVSECWPTQLLSLSVWHAHFSSCACASVPGKLAQQ